MKDFIPADEAKAMSKDALFAALESGPEGLSQTEAKKRLEAVGPNELTTKRESALLQFLRYFWGPIPWMIEIAAVLSLVNKDFGDFVIIAVLLVINACIGFFQEHRAANALDALKAQLALKAHARRDGAWAEVEARELVPGDLIRIRLGEIVPADLKLVDGDYVSIDQAALTGESLPVTMKTGDIAYSGSVVKQGDMTALVTGTAGNTFFARTAKLVETAGAGSHFQKAVLHIGNFLIIVALVLCVLLTIVLLGRGDNFWEILQFVLILAVASIPVAMPAVLSVTMALGALALSKQKAIVSRLQSIEELAGIDILCSDKTGTLTKNQITLGESVLLGASDEAALIQAAALASQGDNPDAIDGAVLAGLKDKNALQGYTLSKFTPFDPVSKRTEGAWTDAQGQTVCTSKGAPQVIFNLCGLQGDARTQADATVNQFAAKGLRTLGVARKNAQGWECLGILSLFDPPRDDSKATIEQAIEHGIAVKMVTGDNTAIAAEISGQLGLGRHIQPAGQFFTKEDDPAHLPEGKAHAIEAADGFAEVFPEHKYGIVKALQGQGHIVGMTGDGVNDAPALKQADVGIAVSGATDAARGAAALILTQPGLSVIVKAVELARQIFERMLSYTIYRIAMTVDIMIFVVLAMLLYPVVGGQHFYPLTPIMIILLALLDDIPIMCIAYDHTRTDPKPVRWNMGRVITVATTLGVLSVVQTFGVLWLGINTLGLASDPQHLQSMLFLQLVVAGHLLLFLTRTPKFFFLPPWPSWQLLGAIVVTQIFAVCLCGFGWLVPQLPWKWIGWVWVYNLIWMVGLDIAKVVLYRQLDHKAHHQRHIHAMSKHLGS